MALISLIVGLRPYRQLMATQPLRVLRSDAFRVVWPLRYYLPITALILVAGLVALVGLSTLLWSLLLGMLALALLLSVVGWGINTATSSDIEKSGAAAGGKPAIAPASGNYQPIGGIFAVVYVIGSAAGTAWRSA